MAVAVVVIHLEVDHLNNSGNGGLEGDDPPVSGQPGLHYSRVKEPAHAFMVILAILTYLKRCISEARYQNLAKRVDMTS